MARFLAIFVSGKLIFVRYDTIKSLLFFASATLCLLTLSPGLLFAQETVVSGKITDASSGDPLPFVNVYFNNTTIGVTSDFDGKFEIRTHTPTDTLVASYIGYKAKKKYVAPGETQVIHFQLEEDVTRLQEFVFEAGENPAYAIMRKVVQNKPINDKRKLSGYE